MNDRDLQLRAFFTQRFARMLRQRQVSENTLQDDDWRLLLLNKAEASTYLDMVELDIDGVAVEMLKRQLL